MRPRLAGPTIGRRAWFCWLGWAVGLGVAGVLLLLALWRPAPRYQGRGLAYWLPLFEDTSLAAKLKATEVVSHVGTNALPTLQRWLTGQDSRLKLKLRTLLARQPLVRVRWATADERRMQAIKACRVLGADARPAIPALIDCLGDPSARYEAAHTLSVIDEGLFPLTRAVTNLSYPPAVRRAAAARLGSGPYDFASAAAALTTARRDPAPSVAAEAVRSLARLQAGPGSGEPEPP